MPKKTFTALIHKKDGYYVAKCPEVESVSWGYSVDEAIDNLRLTIEWFFQNFSAGKGVKADFKKIEV